MLVTTPKVLEVKLLSCYIFGPLFALPCPFLASSGLLCFVATHARFIACGNPRPLSLQMSILENLQIKSNVKAMSENHSDFIDIDSSALFSILTANRDLSAQNN